jgi:hypothetical protein
MLTGARPFHATSVPALLGRICDEEPIPVEELRPDVPPGVADVLAIALAKRRDERYASVKELARDLRAALAGASNEALARRVVHIHRGRPASRAATSPVAGVSPTARTQDAVRPVGFDDTVTEEDNAG